MSTRRWDARAQRGVGGWGELRRLCCKVGCGGIEWGSWKRKRRDRPHVGGLVSREGRGAVFLGEYQHTLDAKGRVSLPRKFRDEIGSHLVVSKGLDNCLYVYPAEGYRRFVESLMNASDFDRKSLALRRRFTAGASEVEIDSAGRVGLAPVLRAHAALSKDVVVVGVGDRIEIWDAEAWASYEDENESTIWDAAEELSRSGIL